MNPGFLMGRGGAGWGATGIVSVALHVLVIAVAMHSWLLWVRPMAPAGTVRGTQRVLLYMLGGASASDEVVRSAPVKMRQAAVRVSRVALKMPAVPESAVGALGLQTDLRTGNDAAGTGNVNIAWVQGFPAARPDLSWLGSSSAEDVVVDVVIDDTGKVARAKAKKGMGHGIDEVVVTTVEQWIFYPAMRNGRAVASEQELRFHFERGRGAEPCGWDCFALAVR